MEQQLKCILLLPLREMTLRKVVTLLFSGSDVLVNASQLRHLLPPPEDNKDWQERVEDVVEDKLLKLELPKELMNDAKVLIRPISSELRRWILLHDFWRNSPTGDNRILGSLCWTSVGAIDERKTAEFLVRSDLVDIQKRYELACDYCLEESIHRLWRELPEEMKSYYSMDLRYCLPLPLFRPHILSGELLSMNHLLSKGDRILTSFDQWCFEYSVENGLGAATKYFFEKITFAERVDSLVRSVHTMLETCVIDERPPHFIPVLSYLLTVMTPEERVKIVERHPIHVLLVFLCWPLQDFFVDNARLAWTFLSPDSYYSLLVHLSDSSQRLGPYFPKLFREFFIQSPLALKEHFTNEWDGFRRIVPAKDFLSLFLKSWDSESITVIFRYLDAAGRMHIVFDQKVKRLFFESILKGRWDMVEVCLKEATLSKEDKKSWKEGFMNRYRRHIKRGDPKWEGFFKFFYKNVKQRRGRKRQFTELLDN